MSVAARILPDYTYADYVHWEGKWELIEGIPYAMSPAPVPKHQRITANLKIEFGQQLKSCKKCRVYDPLDYLVDDNTILQPDMLVVCGEIEKKYLDFAPALVAEVLSPATVLKDRHTKYGIYESRGVKYYLIIAPDTEEVEVYRLEGEKEQHYVLQEKGHGPAFDFSFDSCRAAIDFKEIW